MLAYIYSLRFENGEQYIGSTCFLNKRFYTHKRLLKNNKHHSIILQNAFNKYLKYDEIILEKFNFINKEHLLKVEQGYITILNAKYNAAKNVFKVFNSIKINKKDIIGFFINNVDLTTLSPSACKLLIYIIFKRIGENQTHICFTKNELELKVGYSRITYTKAIKELIQIGLIINKINCRVFEINTNIIYNGIK